MRGNIPGLWPLSGQTVSGAGMKKASEEVCTACCISVGLPPAQGLVYAPVGQLVGALLNGFESYDAGLEFGFFVL